MNFLGFYCRPGMCFITHTHDQQQYNRETFLFREHPTQQQCLLFNPNKGRGSFAIRAFEYTANADRIEC